MEKKKAMKISSQDLNPTDFMKLLTRSLHTSFKPWKRATFFELIQFDTNNIEITKSGKFRPGVLNPVPFFVLRLPANAKQLHCSSSRPRKESKQSQASIFFMYTITALFTNMRILKFKSQLTIAVFAAVNHLKGPFRKQNFTWTGSKVHGLWFVIGGFCSVLCVSVFQGSLLLIVIMIDGSEKRKCEGGFWTLEFACLWKAQ